MTSNPNHVDPQVEKGWMYIGRFLWQFGILQSLISEIFLQLYDLERVAIPFSGLLNTRKKLTLVEEGLKEQGDKRLDPILKRVHELHDLRNALAHCSFFIAEEGMTLDHITSEGKWWGENREEDNYVGFAELDRLYQDGLKLESALNELYSTLTPISSPSKELRAKMEAMIDLSPNVVRYKQRPPSTT